MSGRELAARVAAIVPGLALPTSAPAAPPAPFDYPPVKNGAWVLPSDVDPTRPAWRLQLEEHRARLRSELGAVDPRPEQLQRCFTESLVFLYERGLFDPVARKWKIDAYLDRARMEFGGFDQIILWQSYPRLGIDGRNQFDYYRDLPGGLPALAECVKTCHARGVRVLLNYNPWDTATRKPNNHLADMLDLLRATGADGVYLDTMAAVPKGWAEAMKALGRPIAFESEGNPGGGGLPGMHSSWGQGYTVNPPHQVFAIRWLVPPQRVFLTENRHDRNHWEEVCCSFFNGAGVLVWENVFGNDTAWVDRDKALLRALLPIQRAFWANFSASDWQPLAPTADVSLRMHCWPGKPGTIWTICRATPEAYAGPLAAARDGRVYLDLISGKELPVRDGKVVGEVAARGVAAVLETGALTEDLRALLKSVCPGRLPAYEQCDTARLKAPAQPVRSARLGRYHGKAPATLPDGMVWVRGGDFVMKLDHKWHGARCYAHDWGRGGRKVKIEGFAMDRFPVTNREFAAFLRNSGYKPADTHNFLRHWIGGNIPAGLDDHPVVNVALEDARAYAAWAGKRLPTEAEWQYAAGGAESAAWPWGAEPPEAERCNPGGVTTAVGSFPRDASPFGVRDLVGNVWQWTDDVYEDRVQSFAIIKGGSHFRIPAGSSDWYMPSGPCPLTSHGKVPLLAPSLDRFSTVGFRCVID